MTVLKRRSRLVTFRVSADEYETLTKACVGSGARSIAEFTRAAVMQELQVKRTPAGTLSGDLMTLSRALGELDAALLDIRKIIRGVLGPDRSTATQDTTNERQVSFMDNS